jgi:penicillin amidase
MRYIRKIFLYLFLLVFASLILLYIYFQMQKPVYSGTFEMPKLNAPVTTYMDNYGVPHIYGSTEEDVFRTLGYMHAKERLFQMELLRRATGGRLSEIFGTKTIEVDKFFRTLGFNRKAEVSATEFLSSSDTIIKKNVLAYIDGINQYINTRRKRFEFLLLQIPKEEFTLKDIFLISDFIAFNFQMGFKTDPLMTRIRQKFGDKYLADLGIEPHFQQRDTFDNYQFDSLLTQIETVIPVQAWLGSNSWAVSAERSKSGKVLFENDTHIGVQQPAVWYEAHLNAPGFNFYGSFIAGFPFAPIGHSLRHAWGLTIMENDDVDFFAEHISPTDSNVVEIKGQWEAIQSHKEIIHVRDSEDVIINCRTTSHGPIISDVLHEFSGKPVSLCWTYLKFPNNLPEVVSRMNHSTSMDDFREAVSMLAAPGLNVIYADAENNIAWYAAAKLVMRRPGLNSNVVLDGSGEDDWEGYYDFRANPRIENPTRGVVLSANNPPVLDSTNWIPGYYLPPDRMMRINQFFHSQRTFDLKDMQRMNTDVVNINAPQIVQLMLARIPGTIKLKSQIHERVADILDRWNGSHELTDIGPVIYYKWLYCMLQQTFGDELGEKDLEVFLQTHAEKNAVKPILENASSLWWDNIKTISKKETETEILTASFDSCVSQLIRQFGPNPDKWQWRKVHTIEIAHPVGQQKPLDEIFNIGPYPVNGGIETVSNYSFTMNEKGEYKVNLSAALRRTLDFADPENAYSISPSGQSGNFMSRYYHDQTKMYIGGRFRKEMMNKHEIETSFSSKLQFVLPR